MRSKKGRVAYVFYDKADPFELPCFVAVGKREAVAYAGCTASDFYSCVSRGLAVRHRYRIDKVVLDE